MAPNPGEEATPHQVDELKSLLERLTNDSRLGGIIEDLDSREVDDLATGESHAGLNPQSIESWIGLLSKLEHEENSLHECEREEPVLKAEIKDLKGRLLASIKQTVAETAHLEIGVLPEDEIADEDRAVLDTIKEWIQSHPDCVAELRDLGVLVAAPSCESVQKAIDSFAGLSLATDELKLELPELEVKAHRVVDRLSTLADQSSKNKQLLQEKFAKLLVIADNGAALKAKLKVVGEERDTLSSELGSSRQSYKSLEGKYGQVCSENTASTQNLQTVRGELERSQVALRDSERKAALAEKSLLSTRKLVETEQTEKMGLLTTQEKLTEQVDALRNEKLALQDEKSAKVSALQHAEEQLDSVRRKCSDAEQKAKTDRKTIESLTAEVKRLTTASKASDDKASSLQTTLSQQEKSSTEKDDLIQGQNTSIQQLKETTTSLETKLSKATSDCKELKSELKTLGEEKSGLETTKQEVELAKEESVKAGIQKDRTMKTLEGESMTARKQLEAAENLAKSKAEQLEESERLLNEHRTGCENHVSSIQTLEGSNQRLGRDLSQSQSEVSQIVELLSSGAGAIKSEALIAALSATKAFAEHLDVLPLEKPSLTIVHGLTADLGAGPPALQQALALKLQACSSEFKLSASSVGCLVRRLKESNDGELRTCVAILVTVITQTSSRPSYSMYVSIIVLELFEAVLSCLKGHTRAIVAVQELFNNVRPKLDVDSVFVRAMTVSVSMMLRGEQPVLADLLVIEKGISHGIFPPEASALDGDAAFQVLLDEDLDLLFVLANDKMVGALRAPFFRLDMEHCRLESAAPRVSIVFEEAPLVGSCTLDLILDHEDLWNTLNRFRPLMQTNRMLARFTAADRLPVELIDN